MSPRHPLGRDLEGIRSATLDRGAEAIKATWRSPQDIKDQYASASICGNNRVVFNIGGNKYRLVVEVQYQAGIVWVKFVGTHAQYDRIDVETVNDD